MRKKLIILLSSVLFVLLGVLTACSSGYKLIGLTPKAEITVMQGDFVEVETLHVYDNLDNYYNVKYKVVDSEEKQIALSGKGFFAEDAGVYRIVYTVLSVKGAYQEETVVNVRKSSSSVLNIHVPETTDAGSLCQIVISAGELEKYSFSVSVEFNGTAVPVNDYAFMAAEAGSYLVTVTATSAEETYEETYTVIARQVALEGEVEVFDSSWSNQRGEWRVATTAETNVKDRFGGNGSYLAIETDIEYLNAFISPKMSKSYYQALAEDGYEYVSVWLYIDGFFSHVVQQYKGNGSFYQTTHNVPAKTWYEIRYNLQDDPQYDFQGSFLKAFDSFADQTRQIFTLDNSDEYNVGNGGRERDEKGNPMPFRVYIDDIYAVKTVSDIAIDGTVNPELKTGDTCDLKDFIRSDSKDRLLYTVTYRDEMQVAEGGNYTFTADGEYEITVGYGTAQPNRYGSVSFTLNVGSPYTASIGSLIKEKSGESVQVNLGDLNALLKDGNGNRIPDVTCRYSVVKNGKQITVNDGKVSLSEAGRYEVEVEIGYRIQNTDCKTYVRTELDIWDEESKYTVFSFDGNTEYFADSYYMNAIWESAPETSVVEKADGVRGTFLKMEITNQQQPVLAVKPMYSLNYYRWLFRNEPSFGVTGDPFVTFDYMVEDLATTERRTLIVYPSKSRQSVACGTWNTVSFSLEEFLDGYYAQLDGGYEYLNGLRGGAYASIDPMQGYALFYMYNQQIPSNVYIGECKLQLKPYETASEWAERLNAADKVVADYTKEEYVDNYEGTSMTYFERNHSSQWFYNQPTIETMEVDGETGKALKFVTKAGYVYAHRMYIPNTMDITALKEFAAVGYRLKIKVFIDEGKATSENRTVYTLQYDSAASGFVSIASSTRTTTVKTLAWQEVEIDVTDYIRLMEQLGGNYGQQLSEKTSVLAVSADNGSVFVSQPYLVLPEGDKEIIVAEGGTADLTALAPQDGKTYEYYVLNGQELDLQEETTLVVNETLTVAVVLSQGASRTFVSCVKINAGSLTVTDYTKAGYVESYAGTSMTYFQKNHNVYPRASTSAIVTETVGGVEGRYARVTADSGINGYNETIYVYLPNTMDMETLKQFAADGFVLKVKAYVDAPTQTLDAFVLEYDEGASAFKKIHESSRATAVQAGVWEELEIDIGDYIRLCEQLGNCYENQINNTQGVLGIRVNQPWTIYFSELYLVAPAD